MKTVKLNIIRPIKIRDYQKEHFQKVLQILQNEIAYLDYSPMGTGKTLISLGIAVVYKMGIIVICPKTAISHWIRHTKTYGIPLYNIMTYHSLRGSSSKELNHDLLVRDGDSFFPTEKLQECARKGLLVVFDECHALKNENSQLRSAHALVNECRRLSRMGYNTRVACLSATPADQKENISSLFKILGVIGSDKLYKYNRSSKIYELVGLQEAINKCNRYDRDATFYSTCRPINKTTIKTISHDLYTRVLKSHITSGMPKPPTEAKLDVKNLFAIMPPEDVEQIKRGAMLFSSATNYRHESGEISYDQQSWGDIIKSRREIDSGKVNTMARLARERLEENPHCKVILYYTYKRDIYRTAELLKEYTPLILTGDVVKNSDRDNIIEKFQRDDDEYRVLISNPKVGGIAIELDDKFGTRNRYMYILPNYHYIDLLQAMGRIHREGTQSDAVIRFIYSKSFPFESSILKSMAEKSKTVRDILTSKQKDVILPGEIDSIMEVEEEI